jgi:hypothetical protein
MNGAKPNFTLNQEDINATDIWIEGHAFYLCNDKSVKFFREIVHY